MDTSSLFKPAYSSLLFVLVLLSNACTAPQPPAEQEAAMTASTPEQVQPVNVVPAPPPVEISVNAVGDIMLGTDYPDHRLTAGDGKELLQGVAAVLRNADITFGNLEGTILTGGEAAKTCRNPARCYVFRSPPHYSQYLVDAGFDVLSLANNHARDFGDEGRIATMQNLDAVGLRHSGVMPTIASWEVKGRKVAMIAFAPFRGAHDMLDLSYAARTVTAVAGSHDIVIVSMHGGAEGEDKLHVPFAEEFFHGENRGDVVAFARTVIDAGADLVLGHGPHVPRALELYQGRLVAYSLGNFCTALGINVRGKNGLAPILRAEIDGDGRFLRGQITSARQVRPHGPRLDTKHSAARLMQQLTLEDFPDTPIKISGSGEIRIKTSKRSKPSVQPEPQAR